MIDKYKVRFSLIQAKNNKEEKQIYIICTINSVEVFYYSGYRVYSENFIKKTISLKGGKVYIQEVKANTFNKNRVPASRINARLREMEIAAQKIYEKHFKGENKEDFTKEKFKKLLGIELGDIEESDGSVKTENNILVMYDRYMEDLKVKGKYNRHFKTEYNRLKLYFEIHPAQNSVDKFDVEQYKKYLTGSISHNTMVVSLKRLRTFFNKSKKNKNYGINRTPFDEISFSEDIGTEVYSEPICMTREELSKLYNSPMKTKHAEVVRDMFCLQSALGCRVGDFLRLTYDNIQNDQLIYYPEKIEIDNKYMLDKIVVPLSSRAKEIINKYKSHDTNNLIMPFINSVKYNKSLKKVFKDAGLDRVVMKYDIKNKKEEFCKLHEIATSHLARRTFVDILCQAGEPIHVVASMSGHSENSKAFERYRRRPENMQKKAVNRSMD